MGAGERLMHRKNQLLGGCNLPDFLRQLLRLLQAVTMGDGNPLVLGIHHLLGLHLRQLGNGALSAANFAADHDFAIFIAPKHGLDLEHGAQHRRHAGYPSGAL